MASTNYNNNKTYKKDKKITILGTVTTENEMGDIITETKPIKNGENIWAYYRQASVKEINEAASTNYKVDAIFRVGWRNNVDYDNIIVFKGKEYHVTRIDDFEGYKRDLTIYAYMREYD